MVYIYMSCTVIVGGHYFQSRQCEQWTSDNCSAANSGNLRTLFWVIHLNPPLQTLRSSVLWGWIRGWRNVGWRRTHQVETEGMSVYVDERSRFSFWAEMYFFVCTFLRWLSSFLLQVENTIRWRAKRDEEGNETRESNARIVKWSDGRCVL